MIKKDSYTWKIYGWVVAVLCIVPAFLHAQEKDFTTWASAGFKYKVKPAFTLSGKLEWRTKDDLGKTDRWGLDVGGAYSVLPFLKVAAGYEIHYRNRGEAGWKFVIVAEWCFRCFLIVGKRTSFIAVSGRVRREKI